ncbi:MAG: hypothetical protein ACJ79S_04480 [Gemmatimonadaceae bacterium]
MRFDELLRAFWARPTYQRVMLAFTVGLFLACSARMAESGAARDAAASARVSGSAAAPPVAGAL